MENQQQMTTLPPRSSLHKVQAKKITNSEKAAEQKRMPKVFKKIGKAMLQATMYVSRFLFALTAAVVTWSAIQVSKGVRYAHNKMIKLSLLVLLVVVIVTGVLAYSWGKMSVHAAAPVKMQTKVEKPVAPSVDNVTVVPKKPVTVPKELTADSFANEMSTVFSDVPKDRFKKIYNGYKMINSAPYNDNMPLYFVAGIAWKETGFDPTLTSPPIPYQTKDANGNVVENTYYSRGMYQVFDLTGKEMFGDPSANVEYNEDTNIAHGMKILHTYRSWLQGKNPGGDLPSCPDSFKAFKRIGDQRVMYDGKLVVDQNGKPVPLDLLTALAYNGGPGTITNALDQDGYLIMYPYAEKSKRNLTIQQLGYVVKINKYMYNFGYSFAYGINDIPAGKELTE